MAFATVSAEIDAYDKENFDALCKNLGISISAAINMFVKAALKEKRIPSDPYGADTSEDPFYSEENMERLRKSKERIEHGKYTIHNLVEA